MGFGDQKIISKLLCADLSPQADSMYQIVPISLFSLTVPTSNSTEVSYLRSAPQFLKFWCLYLISANTILTSYQLSLSVLNMKYCKHTHLSKFLHGYQYFLRVVIWCYFIWLTCYVILYHSNSGVAFTDIFFPRTYLCSLSARVL